MGLLFNVPINLSQFPSPYEKIKDRTSPLMGSEKGEQIREFMVFTPGCVLPTLGIL